MDAFKFLASLPPPKPITKKPRGPTRKQFIQTPTYDFIDDEIVTVVKNKEEETWKPNRLIRPCKTPPIAPLNSRNTNNHRVFYKLAADSFETKTHKSPSTLIESATGRTYGESTSIACYWDTHRFKCRPVGIPIRYVKSKETFECHGYFCSYSCALAYATSNRTVKFSGFLLAAMRKSLDNTPVTTPLTRAPHWSSLTRFGGHLTISKFRKKLNVRISAIPEHINFIPFGFNLFEMSNIRRVAKERVNIERKLQNLAPVSTKKRIFSAANRIKKTIKKNRTNKFQINRRSIKSTMKITKKIIKLS